MNPSALSIPERFAATAARHAHRVAVSDSETIWTYAELDRCSTVLACQILDRASPGPEPVALLLEHGALLVAAILGALKAGRMYLALDPADPPARVAALLNDSQARMLFSDAANMSLARSLAPGSVQVVEIRDTSDLDGPATRLPEVPAEAGAWLMYTSGSTGSPKGVWQNHRGAIHHADVYGELIRLTPDDRLTLLTSCSLAASTTHLFGALLNGAALCPFPVRTLGTGRLPSWLREQRITVYHSVPTVFRHWMRTMEEDASLGSVRLIRLGGEPVLRSDVELFRRHCPASGVLMHALSATETGLVSALMIDRATPLPDRRISAGPPVRDVEVTLVDERGQPVAAGAEGRIAIRSAFLSQGYWRQPQATQSAFRSDATDPARRLFISADLGRFHAHGGLEHLGRVDQVVKIRGQRVDLAEVEAALCATPCVAEAAVVAREEPSGDRWLVAYVVPRNGNQDVGRACRQALGRLLPDPMIPSGYVELEKLPQTPSGKVDRRALPAPSSPEAGAADRSGAMPRDGFERKVARVWQSVFGLPAVSRTDDFYDLGGTSLQATELIAGIEATFNVVLPPSVLIEHSTVEKLAAAVADRAVIRAATPLVVLRKADTGRPLFLVHSGHGDVATYGQLARRLNGRPIYGLQAVGLQGECWPLMSVCAMARRYLPEIIGADPSGPYLLGGTCMGGLVAFELARLLGQQGRRVGLVALLDTTAPPFGGQRSPWIEMLIDPVRDAIRIARWALLRGMGQGRHGRSLPAYRRFIGSMTGRARYYYRPGFYPGVITAFVTAGTVFEREDRRPLMGRHAREMRVITIPGRREELFLPPALDVLAREFQGCLEKADVGGA